jgi:hypothetical protein
MSNKERLAAIKKQAMLRNALPEGQTDPWDKARNKASKLAREKVAESEKERDKLEALKHEAQSRGGGAFDPWESKKEEVER